MVDGSGRPLAFVLTGGQAHDAPILPALLDHPVAPLAVVADKAYDNEAVRDDGAVLVIPVRITAKRQQRYDRRLYRLRNIVERFFCRLKDMRRLATRFDKLTRNFLAAIYLFAARFWASY